MALNSLTASSLLAVTTAGTSAAISSDSSVRKQLAVQVALVGTITNVTLDLSICTIDAAGIESWQPKKTVAVRTPPGGSKVAELALFEVYGVLSAKIALETAITGGGTATLYYSFV